MSHSPLEQEASPLVAQQQLAQQLMNLRVEAGLTQDQVAKRLGVSVSTVLRSEALPGVWSPTFLRALGAYYNLSEQRQQSLLRLRAESRAPGWWVRQGLGVSTNDLIRVGLRGDVRQVYGWALNLVPEMMQTAEYARAVESHLRPTNQKDTESAVALLSAIQRRVRQREIIQRYVVDEGVLRRRVGGTAVMVHQLEILSALARRGRLRVLAHFGPMSGLSEGFELCTIPGLDEQVVYFPQRRETHIGTLPSGHTPEALQHVVERLWENAENPKNSLKFIEQAQIQMRTGTRNSSLHHRPLFLHGPSHHQHPDPATAHSCWSAGEG